MMKKILLTLLLVAGLVLATNNKKIHAAETAYVDISISREVNTVSIEHLTNYNITGVVVEYAFVENNKRYAELINIDVIGDKFTVDPNWYALIVHQIKVTKDKTTYIYQVNPDSNNTVGEFGEVQRRKLVEIETVDSYVRTLRYQGGIGNSELTFEYYFNFKENHDEIISVDVHYVMVKKKLFQTIRTNHEKTVKSSDYYDYKDSTGKNQRLNLLEHNTDTTKNGQYVVRIEPGTVQNLEGTPENFAILRILYMIDGEFIMSDVINPPYELDKSEDVQWIYDFIDDVKEFFLWVKNFFTQNGNTILKVIIVIIALIFLPIIIFFGRTIFNIFKSIYNSTKFILKAIFSIPGIIINVLKFLFIMPEKKSKNKERKRY